LSTKLYAATKRSVNIIRGFAPPLAPTDAWQCRMESLQLAELLADIDIALDAEEFERALGLIEANLIDLPNPGPLQIRIADAAVAMDLPAAALPVYRRAMRYLSRRGFPSESLAALVKLRNTAERVDSLDGSESPDDIVANAIDEWTSLFARASDRLDPETRIHPLPTADAVTLDPTDSAATADERIRELLETSSDRPPPDVPDDSLPAVPLVSDLPIEIARRFCRQVTYERYDDVDPVFDQSMPDGDLVWTVSPNVTLGDESPEHRLQPGTLLGLNALGITPRDPGHRPFGRKGTELLRWPLNRRRELADSIDGFDEFLGVFHRHAVVDRLLSTHPLFEAVELDRREDLLDLLEPAHIESGAEIVTQGEPSPGIFVVVDGQVDIVHDGDDWSATIATLGPGGLFGEVGVVSDRLPVASARMSSDGFVLMLPARRFSRAAGHFPKLAKYVVNKARARIAEVESTADATELTEVAEKEES